jgi:branched-subunit amino acid aminotransferase/4-amino-4-deoxychorismate lyase
MNTTTILINGEPSDGRIPVTDSSVLRGDAVFEVLKSYGGVLFRSEDHLDRLEASARKLMLDLPRRSLIADWMERVAAEIGDGAVRVVCTRGSSVPGIPGEPLVIVFGHTWPSADGSIRCRLPGMRPGSAGSWPARRSPRTPRTWRRPAGRRPRASTTPCW